MEEDFEYDGQTFKIITNIHDQLYSVRGGRVKVEGQFTTKRRAKEECIRALREVKEKNAAEVSRIKKAKQEESKEKVE